MKGTSRADSPETPAEISENPTPAKDNPGLYPAPGSRIRLCIYILIVGLATGFGAAGLALIMHGIEYAVYGQHEGDVAAVTGGTTGFQRFVGIVLAELIAGLIWVALRKKTTPIESAETDMSGRLMSVWLTLVNVFLQMGTVAAGASMGRENVSRELGVVMASQMSHRLHIDPLHRRLLVTVVAGAGLGMIYHIPLAGAVFSLEILLGSLSITAVMVVLAYSAIAIVTSGIVVGSNPFHSLINLSDGWGNLGAVLLPGVICGAIDYTFHIVTSWVMDKAPTGWHSAWAISLAFTLVGVMSLWVPEVLGNGRIAATTVLMDRPLLGFVVMLLTAKTVAVLATFRSGTVGGLLTPGFALDALSGFIIGCFMQPLAPLIPFSDFVILGAAMFLLASMAAPLSALIVTVEFTGQDSSAYLALFLAATTVALTVTMTRAQLRLPHK